MSISREIIDEIRNYVQIEDVVAKYVPSLKKKGQNFVGLCPFHKEKTPSFTVSPDKQIFHCFGCHAGGNIYSFISKIENLSFPDSVRFTAKMVGIEVPSEENQERPLEEYYSLLEKTSEVYNSTLLSIDGKRGLDYLLKRGLNEESISTFRLGYAPEGWSFLHDVIKKEGLNLEKAFEVGLLSRKTGSDHYYDKFRDRVIFPIFDKFDRVVAFGGRIIDEGEPKYLNSPESSVYHKRNVLYGLSHAHMEIAEKKQAIVVEGYLDVIGCHQSGIKNVVAPLGTALTSSQLHLLSRYCEEVVLLFDSDAAGLKAANNAVELSKSAEANVRIKVASLPESDPFEFLQTHRLEEFLDIINKADYSTEYQIKASLKGDPTSIDNLKNAFATISKIEYETEKLKYLKYLSEITKIEHDTLFKDYNTYQRKQKRIFESQSSKKQPVDYVEQCFRELFSVLFSYPEFIPRASIDFSEFLINDGLTKSIFKKLCDISSENVNLTMNALFDFFTSPEEREFIEQNINFNNELKDPRKAYLEIYLNLKAFNVDNKINFFSELIMTNSDAGDISDYLIELEIWRKEKEKLSSFLYNLNSYDPNFSISNIQ